MEANRGRSPSITTTPLENKVPESSGNALRKTSSTGEEEASDHWTGAITLGDPVRAERNPVRRAFPRYRLKLDTSPRLSRDAVATIPAVKSFPSGLIPPYSPRWFFVWELIQCSQAAAAGAAEILEVDPGGVERSRGRRRGTGSADGDCVRLVSRGRICTAPPAAPDMFAPG